MVEFYRVGASTLSGETEIKSIKAKSDDVRYGLGMKRLYMMFRMASVCELLK